MDKAFYGSYFKTEKNHWWFRVRRNIIFWLLKKYKVPKTAKIFDFGCGSGYLVGYLQNLGYSASGGDTSPEAIGFGGSQGINNLEVIKDGEIRPPERWLNRTQLGFDLILALDVIEHIQDDYGAIRTIETALNHGGMAIITVPAYQWMWGVQDKVSHHYRRYSMSRLTDVITGSGNLKIIHKTYFNTFLFLPIAIVRILSKWFNLKERESDFDINGGFMNRLFYFIFNLETYFLKILNFPFGISILLVLKKNGQSSQK